MEAEVASEDTKVFGFWVYLMTDLVIFASLLCPAYRSAFAQTPTNYTDDTPSVERLNTEIKVCFGRARKSVHLLQTESSETQRRTTCSSVQNRFPPRKGSQ